MAGTSLAEVMKSLEAVTLADVEAGLAEIDKQIAEIVEPLQKRRDALLQLKRIVAAKEQGPSQRKPRTPRTQAADNPKVRASKAVEDDGEPDNRPRSLASEIQMYLTAAGPSKVQTIADQLERSYQSVYQCVSSRSDLFRKTGAGEFGVA